MILSHSVHGLPHLPVSNLPGEQEYGKETSGCGALPSLVGSAQVGVNYPTFVVPGLPITLERTVATHRKKRRERRSTELHQDSFRIAIHPAGERWDVWNSHSLVPSFPSEKSTAVFRLNGWLCTIGGNTPIFHHSPVVTDFPTVSSAQAPAAGLRCRDVWYPRGARTRCLLF
jgi:hypothetical protein